MSGKKFDQSKLRFDLIPPECEAALASVLTYGAEKYGANNWQGVKPFRDRYYAALQRHMNLRRQGEIFDNESGKLHTAHAFTNAMFLLWRDLHECNDIRPNENRTDSSNTKPAADTVQSVSNDNEAAFRRARNIQQLTGLLDHLQAHQCIGAYRIVSCGDGSVEIVLSTDNETSTYVANFK